MKTPIIDVEVHMERRSAPNTEPPLRVAAGPEPEASYRFGAFVFDPASGDLSGPSETTRLQPLRARLLVHFLEHPGQVLHREALYDFLWPAGYVEQDLGLNAAIRGLRRVLGDDASQPTYIETLRRRGYRFVCPVHRGIPENARYRPSGARLTRWLQVAALVLVLFALVAVGSRVPLGHVGEPGEPGDPRLMRLRHLVEEGSADAADRAERLIASLPADLSQGSEVLGLKARLAYRRGELDRAKVLARQGAQGADPSSEALRTLGEILLYHDWKADAAAEALKRAVE
ncbi:MAG: winged helix-turn-helix domain-containing protein, partial [Gemmatimonadota bacterium]|nr:winged helix-turn-helix domain-containing protein [Gemmatimonadota bacterium]